MGKSHASQYANFGSLPFVYELQYLFFLLFLLVVAGEEGGCY